LIRRFEPLESPKFHSFLASKLFACFSRKVVRVEIPEREHAAIGRRHAAGRREKRHWLRLERRADKLSASRNRFRVAKILEDRRG
jgi:hypothetical protein